MILWFFIIYNSAAPIFTPSGTKITVTGDGEITKNLLISVPTHSIATYISIENDISGISYAAFSSCSSLKEIFIGPSVLKVDGYSFTDCLTLQKIEVSKDNAKFANDANGALTSSDLKKLIKVPAGLTNYKFGDRIESVDSVAFQNSNIRALIISKYVKSLGEASFHNNKIENITFEDGSFFETLDQSAFRYMQSAIYIKFPKSLKTISTKEAFIGCNIKKIEFEENSVLTTINSNFIVDCKIESITLPDTVKEIKSSFIVNNPTLTTFTVPLYCEYIDSQAFSNCPKLSNFIVSENHQFFSEENGIIMNKNKTTVVFFPPSTQSLTIGASCETISGSSIRAANMLTSITIAPENQFLSSTDGMLFNYNKTILIAICGGCNSVTFPSSVQMMEDYAASQCTSLESVDMRQCQITTISESAFQGCTKLLQIDLPPSLQTISANAFSDSSIQRIPLESTKIKTISSRSFRNSGLVELFIPETITFIDFYSIAYCTNLTSVILGCNSGATIQDHIFASSGVKTVTIKSTVKSLGIYIFQSCPIQEFKFEGTSNLAILSEGAFYYSEITQIWIPKSVSVIATICFEGCKSLEIVEFEDGSRLESLSASVFKKCVQLKKVVFSTTLKNVLTSAFIGCSYLKSFEYQGQYMKSIDGIMVDINGTELIACPTGRENVVIMNEIESIREAAFQNCELTSIEINSKNIKNIPNNCFFECQKLIEITIPSSVTILGVNSFYGCSVLKNVFIEENSQLTSVGESSFYGCKNMVLFESDKALLLSEIGKSSFEGCQNLIDFNFTKPVSKIGERAFAGCSSLSTLSIPPIETVSDSCFDGCSALCCITLANGIQSIGPRAFAGTDVLRLRVPQTVTSIGSGALSGIKGLQAVIFCGTKPNADDSLVDIVDDSQKEHCSAYVVPQYSGVTFYGLKALKVLRDDCSLIAATRTATSIFTLAKNESVRGILFEIILSDFEDENEEIPSNLLMVMYRESDI